MAGIRDFFNGLAGSPKRNENRRKVLLAIAIKADTQVGIARRTVLSQATVSTAVRELEGEGLVTGARTDGGRAGRVCLVPTDLVGVGVHVGFNHVTVVARRLDKDYETVSVRANSEGVSRGWNRARPAVQDLIGEAVRDTGCTLSDVFSLGIAVPRMIDPRTNEFTRPVLHPWRHGDDPARDLGEWLGVHAVIDNDANLGALAEQTYSRREHAETVIYVKASTGVGAGIIIHNNLLRGRGGMAGEIGHLTLEPDGVMCQCGGRGCLETVIGAEALVQRVRQARTRTGAAAFEHLEDVIRAAREQDPVCMRVIKDAGRTLGSFLAQLCNLINPDVVVVGGQLTECHLLLEGCKESLHRFALPGAVAEDSGSVLELSELGTRAEAQGALVLGLRGQESPKSTV
ncbi:ROK family transcriptional regulator [Streptomyces sp.]|uniref:ROK family transcriptional regulator n=1 Tax=Streptomyces sp. TaxID=1931 RepID=UPI002D4E5E33|nr:ROK family transcriptional regulator [Streptomyces sp.]HZF90670.1 ROK family transcriptional regulator [Streptomyces sp.]